MAGELRGNSPQQRARAQVRKARLGALIAAEHAAQVGLGVAPMVPTPAAGAGAEGLPPPPPGMEGQTPDLAALGITPPQAPGMGAAAGGSPATGAPVPGLAPPPAIGGAAPLPVAGPVVTPTPPGSALAGTPTAPPVGAMPPLPPGFAESGVTPGPAPTPGRRLQPIRLSREELAAQMPPGVRPVGSVIPAPTLFSLMKDFLDARREGRPLPELQTGGVVQTPEDDTMGSPTLGADLTPEEQGVWDGATNYGPAPPVFEEYLDGPAAKSDNPTDRDMAELAQLHPAIVDGLWGLVCTMAERDDPDLSGTLRRMHQEYTSAESSQEQEPADGELPPAPPMVGSEQRR